jgi:predicted nucleic acid-binding protein
VIVVADASPVRYLILIEHVHVLPALYGSVLVPPAVIAELNQERTPDLVKTWLSNMPEWLQVQAPKQALTSPRTVLGAGEAERLGVPVLGTLRVLVDASEHGFAHLSTAFDRLRRTNFRASELLLKRLLDHSVHREKNDPS